MVLRLSFYSTATTLLSALLNTGIAVPIGYWDKKQRCVSHKLPIRIGDFQLLNEELRRQLRIAEDLVTHAIKNKLPDKGGFVKNSFSPNLDITTISGQVEKAVEQVAVEKKANLIFTTSLMNISKAKNERLAKPHLLCTAM